MSTSNGKQAVVQGVKRVLGDEEVVEDVVEAELKRARTDDGGDAAAAAAAAASSSSSSSSSSSTTTKGTEASSPSRKRLGKKKRFALLLGYVGSNYQGLQMNKGAHTVEDVLVEALYQGGGIDEFNRGQLNKIGWARASRTDKGVHAAGSVVAARLVVKDEEAYVTKVNAALPDDVSLLAMTQVTGKFNPKNRADSRLYEYLLPCYVLREVDRDGVLARARDIMQRAQALPDHKSRAQLRRELEEESMQDTSYTHHHQGKQEGAQTYDEAVLERLRTALGAYVGTHRYHNFTSGVQGHEDRAKRYIKRFECSEPFEVAGMPVVRLAVHGQSFLLHQIRKMVAVALMVARKQAPMAIYERAFDQDTRVSLPMAPSFPLLLAKIHYDVYSSTSGHDVNFERQQETVERFKHRVLYTHIVDVDNGHAFGGWLWNMERYFLFNDDVENEAAMIGDDEDEEDGDKGQGQEEEEE